MHIWRHGESQQLKLVNDTFASLQLEAISLFVDSTELNRLKNVLYKRFVENKTNGIQYTKEDFDSFAIPNLLWDILQKYQNRVEELENYIKSS